MENPLHSRGFDVAAARAHLRRRDRRLARWLERIEPLGPLDQWHQAFDPVDALARSICHQQLSGKAAATIVGRLENALGTTQLGAAAMDRLDDPELLACGLSRNKLRALRDLAAHEKRGEIPTMDEMAGLSDQAIVDALVKVRGIGRWTVEMLLIFRLGRPDVLPLDDLGVRKGLRLVDRLDDVPDARFLASRGERWGPYRSCAALALWRIADLGTVATKPPPGSSN